MPISKNMVNMLLSIIETNKIDSTLYNELDDSEKDVIENLTSSTGIDKLHHIRYDQKKINDLINRYNILKGEILINNDNPDLLKQLRNVVLQLTELDILKPADTVPLLRTIFMLL